MSDLAARLVHDAAEAIERETLILHRRWEIESRAAVVAVLEALDAEGYTLVDSRLEQVEFGALAERVKEARNG